MTDGLKRFMRDLDNCGVSGFELVRITGKRYGSGFVATYTMTDAGRELLELLRREAALERIAETGARCSISQSPNYHPMSVYSSHGGLRLKLGNPGDPLTADIAEAAADWAEAQVAPNVCKCKHCGKRCE